MTFTLTAKMFNLLISADTHIGRFDPAMLTDHQLMELFFTPDETDPGQYHRSGDQDDPCSWKGVLCTEEKSVLKIKWSSMALDIKGTLDFTKMPRKVIRAEFYKQRLFGEVDTSTLPYSLLTVCLMDCKFSGRLELHTLPPNIESFIVEGNCFTSVGDICDLPRSLRTLRIREASINHTNIFVGKLSKNNILVNVSGCGLTDVTYEDQEDAKYVRNFN